MGGVEQCTIIKDTFGDVGKKLRYARSGRDCYKQLTLNLVKGRLLQLGWCIAKFDCKIANKEKVPCQHSLVAPLWNEFCT